MTIRYEVRSAALTGLPAEVASLGGDLDALLAARNELIEARLKHIDLQGLEAIARTRLHLAYGEAK